AIGRTPPSRRGRRRTPPTTGRTRRRRSAPKSGPKAAAAHPSCRHSPAGRARRLLTATISVRSIRFVGELFAAPLGHRVGDAGLWDGGPRLAPGRGSPLAVVE